MQLIVLGLDPFQQHGLAAMLLHKLGDQALEGVVRFSQAFDLWA